MKRAFVTAALVLTGAVGCGGSEIVPVSGVVKLNGKPYRNAVVSFQPVGNRDSPNPGRGSAGVTDADGRYTLTYDGERPGALVGKHRVRIFTQQGGGGEEGGKGKAVRPQRFAEPIPIEWHEKSMKTFEVPTGGTDAANFDILTKSAAMP